MGSITLFIVIPNIAILIFYDIQKKNSKELRRKIIAFIPLALYIFFLVIYVFQKISGDRSDIIYWSQYFPKSWLPWHVFKWAYMNSNALLGYLFFSKFTLSSANYQMGLVGMFLLLLGTAWFIKQKKYLICGLCWGPILSCIGAAFLYKWPYGSIRTMLFILPFFIVLIAGGIELVWFSVKSNISRMFIMFACIAILIPQSWIFKKSFEHIKDSNEAIKTLSKAITPDISDSDYFLVYYAARGQFKFYFPQYLNRTIFQSGRACGNPNLIKNFVKSNIFQKRF